MAYTKEQTLKAIKKSRGIISNVMRKLGCEWNTASSLVKRWPETRQAFDDENERMLDIAESTLFDKVEVEQDFNATKYYLSTKGRKRGYIDRTEQTVKQTNTNVDYDIEKFQSLSDEDLEKLREITSRVTDVDEDY